MYACPNCGANMRYDIKSKKLFCDYCENKIEPLDHPKAIEEAGEATYDATVFTCPQCGGEIVSTDHEAATSCPFCGSSVALEGRLSGEKTPESIIPFRITKKNCIQIYQDGIKKVWCLPKDLKSEDHLEKFQGIYLPYWIYNVTQKGPVRVNGVRVRGDTREYCHMNFNLDTEFDTIQYDGSSSFDDALSLAVAPFRMKDLEDFSTAYMSGFCADTEDVPSHVYREDAKEDANLYTLNHISKRSSKYKGMSVNEPDNMNVAFHTKVEKETRAMLPVWFLTYRNRNRVAYAVVNGQTGKMTADLPVDIKQFLLFSLGFAALAFVPLSLLVMLPSTMLKWALALSIGIQILYVQNIRKLVARETHANDKGYLRQDMDPKQKRLQKLVRKKRKKSNNTDGAYYIGVIGAIAVFMLAFTGSIRLVFMAIFYLAPYYYVPFIAISLYLTILCIQLAVLGKKKLDIFPDTLCLLAGQGLAFYILYSRPVHDYWYYGAAAILFASMLFNVVRMIVKYNVYCTHGIPNFFDRKGGTQA